MLPQSSTTAREFPDSGGWWELGRKQTNDRPAITGQNPYEQILMKELSGHLLLTDNSSMDWPVYEGVIGLLFESFVDSSFTSKWQILKLPPSVPHSLPPPKSAATVYSHHFKMYFQILYWYRRRWFKKGSFTPTLQVIMWNTNKKKDNVSRRGR